MSRYSQVLALAAIAVFLSFVPAQAQVFPPFMQVIEETAVNTFSGISVSELYTREVNPYSAGTWQARVVARRTSDGAARAFVANFATKRAAEGNAVVPVLGTISSFGDVSMSTCIVTVVADGTSFDVNVAGLALSDIAWGVEISGRELVDGPDS